MTPGQAVHFTGVLTNPTDTAVSLTGRPGFTLEIFCVGTQGRTGINQRSEYLLNNRPVHAVPAHGSVRFDLVAQLPKTPFPGPQLIINWRLLAVGMGQLPVASAQFTVPN